MILYKLEMYVACQFINCNIVACCQGFLGQQCCARRFHGPKSLTGFKLYATSANNVVIQCMRTQHVWPNNVASVCMGINKTSCFCLLLCGAQIVFELFSLCSLLCFFFKTFLVDSFRIRQKTKI